MILKKAQSSAAEERLTRAIEHVIRRYNGDLGAFFRHYQQSVSGQRSQTELPLQPSLSTEPVDRDVD